MFNPQELTDASDAATVVIEAANAAELQAAADRQSAIDAIKTSNASLTDFLAKREAALSALQADANAATAAIADHASDVLPAAIPVPAAAAA